MKQENIMKIMRKKWNNRIGWSVFTKRGLGARLSCSEEDFATEKCRSIDRLAEKGFCNKSSNKPSLLNRKQFPRASSYIPDTNWPFKWSLRKVIDYFQLFFISIKPIIAMHCHSRTIAEKCSFVIKKTWENAVAALSIAWVWLFIFLPCPNF